MRIGEVIKVVPAKKFGFIRSADLREDVFFHFSIVDTQPGRRDLQAGDEVEYEIDEFARLERQELKATLVRLSPRPLTLRLKASDAPQLHSHHHPKARQKRPTWRKAKSGDPSPAPDANSPDANSPDANSPDANSPESNSPESSLPESSLPESNSQLARPQQDSDNRS